MEQKKFNPMEQKKIEQIPLPEITQCKTSEDYEKLTDKWYAEGFRIAGKEENGTRLQSLVDAYRGDPEITDIRLTTCYIPGTSQNDYRSVELAGFTAVWIKEKKK
ncbi:MAG: hypothetical protein WC348_01135 [Patescibacteria group bacterium]|jgi:hypothetical protein